MPLLFYHEYFSLCRGEMPSFSLLLAACDLLTIAELKITYCLISLLKSTLAQTKHKQNAVLLTQML